jgi:hypothetical protein
MAKIIDFSKWKNPDADATANAIEIAEKLDPDFQSMGKEDQDIIITLIMKIMASFNGFEGNITLQLNGLGLTDAQIELINNQQITLLSKSTVDISWIFVDCIRLAILAVKRGYFAED